jgi:hypothetical protein
MSKQLRNYIAALALQRVEADMLAGVAPFHPVGLNAACQLHSGRLQHREKMQKAAERHVPKQ